VCVNSASTVLRGAGDSIECKAKPGKARSNRVRQGVNERLDGDALFSLEKPVYSTSKKGTRGQAPNALCCPFFALFVVFLISSGYNRLLGW